jgi:DNA-binding transcriptional LysR family regulator
VVQQLFEEDLMLVVPQGHPMADSDLPLALEDLAEMELLLPLPGTSFRDELDSATRPLGISLQPAAEIDGLRLIASLAFEGYGPAILPATAIPGFLADRFRPVPVAGLPRRRVGVAQRSRGLPSAPTRALIELLVQVVARPEGRPNGLHVPD